MNRKRLITLVVAAAVVLVILIVLLFVLLNQPKTETPVTPTDTTNASVTTNTTTITTTETNSNSSVPVVTPNTNAIVTDDRQLITSTAISFTERFGSYSSDTHYENIDRSKFLMTDKMVEQANKLVDTNSQGSDTFVSVQSDVTTSTITDFSNGASGATVEVSVRQTKLEGTNPVVASNVRARLTLNKVNGSWKVDSFQWL